MDEEHTIGAQTRIPVNTLAPTFSVHCSCEQTLEKIQRSFTQTGLRVLETFDLQDARVGQADRTCPYHGTEKCDCQMIVLVIYGEAIAPTTLTLHGNNGRTSISLGDGPSGESEAFIRRAIDDALRAIPAAQGL